MDGLYLGATENGCGHTVFKMQTKQKISVPGITLILMTKDVEDRVKEMGKDEGEQ